MGQLGEERLDDDLGFLSLGMREDDYFVMLGKTRQEEFDALSDLDLGCLPELDALVDQNIVEVDH